MIKKAIGSLLFMFAMIKCAQIGFFAVVLLVLALGFYEATK
jgi:hypothetical protein